LEWSEFAERLSRELARLDRDTILIIREHDEDRHYVQAMREPDRLYAEAVSNNFLEGPLLLTPADEEVLAEAGWQPPTADWAPANWWCELSPVATADDHARLADMMVTALRDVQGVRRPADLVYESFRRHGTGLIELVDFGVAHADPTRITERRGADPAEPPAATDPPGEVAVPNAEQAATTPDGDGTDLEARLAEATQRGDHKTCLELLLSADLVLPLTEPVADDTVPNLSAFATTTTDISTCLLAFTSTEAMAQGLGTEDRAFHIAGFGHIAATWPDPQWSLLVNAGLPTEIQLDSAAVAGLDGMRRIAEQVSTVDAIVDDALAAPSDDATDPASASEPATRLPQGVQLWRFDGDSPSPVAIFDAASSRWTDQLTDTRDVT
jgi:type III secretion system-like peptide-binding chaperone/type III secretion system (T3SS) SseB-like protein